MWQKYYASMRFIPVPGFASIASVVLLAIEWSVDHGSAPTYLLWNLFLAWVPFILALWLRQVLKQKSWASWQGLALSLVLLAFLPNSFYIVSDLIHLVDSDPTRLVYDVVLFASFVLSGIMLGTASLVIIDDELAKRFSQKTTITLISGILLVTSIAIYIGRDLRWNSWDLLINPAGVLFELSARIMQPADYGAALSVIGP